MSDAFSCRMCGHCCHGAGGIVLSTSDLERLARHLELDPDEFVERHVESRLSKRFLTVREDGYCVFYDDQVNGCGVHQARPDVCRAWPFFRGNLIDAESWRMVQDDCKGVNPDVAHAEFARQGRDYLRSEGLLDETGDGPANALKE